MANLFFDLPLPALNGAGAAVDVSTQGGPKTITCLGGFPGATITIEASNDGGATFSPVTVFQNTGGKRIIPIACQYMRVNVSGRKTIVPFSCNVDVGAPDTGVDVAAIPLPVLNGAGAQVDISAFGLFCTFICTGTFDGAAVQIEISEDGNDWATLCQFTGKGGIFSKLVTANFVRAQVVGRKTTLPFSGVVALAAYDVAGGGGSATVGYGLPEQWAQNDVAANQTDVDLSAQVSTNFDTIQMIRDGSLVGLSVRFSEAITAGEAVVSVTLNGVALALELICNAGSNPTGGVVTGAAGAYPYVAGDLVGVQISTDAGFLPVTTDVEAWLQVQELA